MPKLTRLENGLFEIGVTTARENVRVDLEERARVESSQDDPPLPPNVWVTKCTTPLAEFGATIVRYGAAKRERAQEQPRFGIDDPAVAAVDPSRIEPDVRALDQIAHRVIQGDARPVDREATEVLGGSEIVESIQP